MLDVQHIAMGCRAGTAQQIPAWGRDDIRASGTQDRHVLHQHLPADAELLGKVRPQNRPAPRAKRSHQFLPAIFAALCPHAGSSFIVAYTSA
jgi:hypothetical protein